MSVRSLKWELDFLFFSSPFSHDIVILRMFFWFLIALKAVFESSYKSLCFMPPVAHLSSLSLPAFHNQEAFINQFFCIFQN